MPLIVKCRYCTPPYDTWTSPGHLPFAVHGHRFAVTEGRVLPDYVVTHIKTGAMVPGSSGRTKAQAKKNALKVLRSMSRATLRKAIAATTALMASAYGPR